mmetsp:Transcript_23892/g.52687  ORF Transcript_23892/g.52687 Transcript_23892/m.52687 type:complete len:234 (+) Transcript_23892:544-1245(+)
MGMLKMCASGSLHFRHFLRWGCRPQPGMVQSLLCSKSVTRATLEKPQHKIRSALGHFSPLLFRKTDVPLHNLSIQLVQDGVKKRQSASQQHVRDHPDGPQIHLSAVLFLLDNLGGEVKIAAANRLASGQSSWIIFALLGQTKIGDLNFRVAVNPSQKNVLRLQITVHNALAVNVSDSLQQIDHKNLRLIFLVVALLLHSVIQLTTFAQLQDQPYSCCARVIKINQVHNSRMTP